MRILSFSTIFLFLISGQCFAQNAHVKEFKAALAGKVILRDVQDKYDTRIFAVQAPDVDNDADAERLRALKKIVQEKYPRKEHSTARKTTSTVPPPILGINFLADTLSQIPPDNCSAINKTDTTVNVMNGEISVHDATTGNFVSRVALQTFSSVVGLSTSNDYRYDPKVVYDPVADRFICVMLSGTVQYNYIVVAFSQTNDPTGVWNFYKFYGDYAGDTTWFDYPAIAITQNEFFLTGNKIMYDSTWQAGFTRSVIYQMRKADGYSGAATLTYRIWDNIQYDNQPLRCLYPLNPGDAVLGPSQYFLSNRDFATLNDTIFLVQVPDTIGSIDTNLTVTPIVSTVSYGVPPDALQPDTNLTLATNDNRVLGGFIEGSEIQFALTSVNPLNGRSSVYVGKITNFNTTPSLTGQIFSIDSLDFGYPNISFAGNNGGANQSIISFEYSGATTNPGFGAILFDGSDFSDMLVIKGGTNSINRMLGKEQRWGDYSGSQPDWTNPGAVWVEGIFGRKSHAIAFDYGNYMAQLLAPWKVGVPQVQLKPSLASKLYPNPAEEFISFDFNVQNAQNFGFVIYDQLGRTIDKITDRYCYSGENIIRFNIASLAPGNYFLKAIGTDGENIVVDHFVRK